MVLDRRGLFQPSEFKDCGHNVDQVDGRAAQLAARDDTGGPLRNERRRNATLVEPQPTLRERIVMRRRNLADVAAEVRVAEIVGEDNEEIGGREAAAQATVGRRSSNGEARSKRK